MKIARVESFPVMVPLKPERRMITALGEHVVSRYVLVKVVAEGGLEGVGEATVMPAWSGETAWGAKAIIDQVLAPAILGANPCDAPEIDRRLDRAARHNWFAKAALEMACWDIHGKSL